ncbi:ATP-binding protein [Mycobacterium europaeum]|uniref:ATP-binding protein n=1 Tax=Mycobacterium europaeum TaxID=761804 RepID=UPI000A16733D|nr:ATP-binding protein [Mycobacterium europaeum]
MTDLRATPIETVRRIRVPPNPGIFRALGLNQSFEAAVADLIDNSLDAEANEVLVRFVLHSGRVMQLLIVDNGKGMDEPRIDAAMQLGRPKSVAKASHGRYGMGLKAASFGQASTLTVMSKRTRSQAQGRRMYRERPGRDFDVDVLNPETVSHRLGQYLRLVGPGITGKTGTVVQWDDCRSFPQSRDPAVTTAFVDKQVAALRWHLGMVYHRLLERGDVQITVDAYEADDDESGPPVMIEPVNPFPYPARRTGCQGYPKDLVAELADSKVVLRCCIWPARSDSHQYRLYGKPVENFQGLYLYRKNRLLMAGGWGGVIHEKKSYRLARVAIDIDEHLDVFKMSVEKAGVQLSEDLVHAIEQASDGRRVSFRDYLNDAEQAFKKGNVRKRKRTKILPPGPGLHPRVKRAIERESPLLEGEDPIRIRWKRISGDDFVEVDRPNRTLWLNNIYRSAVLHGDPAGINDAPIVKALLFLLYEDLFRGQAMGPKDKENRDFWGEVLTAAAEAEQGSQYE